MTEQRRLADWMREPDHVEHASLAWVTEWINRRPIAETAALLDRVAKFEGALEQIRDRSLFRGQYRDIAAAVLEYDDIAEANRRKA